MRKNSSKNRGYGRSRATTRKYVKPWAPTKKKEKKPYRRENAEQAAGEGPPKDTLDSGKDF